jgi:DNA-binding NarL/FixJ family response regulator
MKDAIGLVICSTGSDSGFWRIEQGRHLIGRSKKCGIQVMHPSLSRRHAELSRKGDKLTIRDLGSRNGVIIDGNPFSPERERVLRLLVRGFSEKEVASQVGTTEYAVHWRVKGLYRYYSVHSRAELVARC